MEDDKSSPRATGSLRPRQFPSERGDELHRRKLSVSGASLEVAFPIGIPASIVFELEGGRRPWRVIWCTERRLGSGSAIGRKSRNWRPTGENRDLSNFRREVQKTLSERGQPAPPNKTPEFPACHQPTKKAVR